MSFTYCLLSLLTRVYQAIGWSAVGYLLDGSGGHSIVVVIVVVVHIVDLQTHQCQSVSALEAAHSTALICTDLLL